MFSCKRISPTTIFVLIFSYGVAHATGLPFLRLSSSARSSALGNAVGALFDIDAVSANPAAVKSEANSVGFTHSKWIQDIQHEYATAVRPFLAGTATAQFSLSHADKLERRVGPSTTPLGTFGVYEWSMGVGYSWKTGTRMRLGTMCKLIRQSIYTESAMGGAIDLGMVVRLFDGLYAGTAVRNLGIMNKLADKSTDMPQQIRMALCFRGTDRARHLSLLEIQATRNSGVSMHSGMEWPITPALALRGGYQTANNRSFSAGFGLNVHSWRVDYSYIPHGSDLGQAHRISLYLRQTPNEHRFRRML